MIARLVVIALLMVVAVCLVTGIRVLLHDGWQRLASAVVWASFALPKALDVVARPADHVAAWLAVRGGKDAPGRERRPSRSEPPAEFAPVPEPDGAEASMLPLEPSPSPAEVTSVDLPPARPYVKPKRPFRRAAMAVAAAVTEAHEALEWGRVQ
jgi:hypothetical protein